MVESSLSSCQGPRGLFFVALRQCSLTTEEDTESKSNFVRKCCLRCVLLAPFGVDGTACRHLLLIDFKVIFVYLGLGLC